MPTKDEALKLALEALEKAYDTTYSDTLFEEFREAIIAIKEALAQPEQEQPKKVLRPEECTDECPPRQVCDFCQGAGGRDKQARKKTK